jgi:hypothetical protein
MRTSFTLSIVAVSLAALSVLAIVALSARADGEGPPPPAPDPAVKIAALERQVAALKADVDFLRARDVALTSSFLAFGRTAQNLHTGMAQARAAGFAAAAIPADSRIAVLTALDALATDLASSPPTLTPAEKELLRHADELRGRGWPK